jgi:hypothetical protein
MAVHGKDYGEKPPTSFPRTLEIDRTDSHIPSAPAATASLTEIRTRKEPSPVRPTFAPFRLILQLEKTLLTRRLHKTRRFTPHKRHLASRVRLGLFVLTPFSLAEYLWRVLRPIRRIVPLFLVRPRLCVQDDNFLEFDPAFVQFGSHSMRS